MSIINPLLNGTPVPLTDVSLEIGSHTSDQPAGILFQERPAVLILKGTGQACEAFVSLCAGNDSELNAVNFSATVQKNSEDAISFDVTEASVSAFDYVRGLTGVGEATLRLLVRKMDLTFGETQVPFEYDAAPE